MTLTELDKLELYLIGAGYVPRVLTFFKTGHKFFERIDTDEDYFNRHQIIVYDENGKRLWDAICHRGSYGYESGLLEIYGNIVNEKEDGDSVVGWLTAEKVIERLEK